LSSTFEESVRIGDFIRNNCPNIDLFFYLVLDNASSVLQHERQKKVVTKLCVAQSLMGKQCFAIVLIDNKLHGGALDGADIFRDTMT
jgi:hypothetical protein